MILGCRPPTARNNPDELTLYIVIMAEELGKVNLRNLKSEFQFQGERSLRFRHTSNLIFAQIQGGSIICDRIVQIEGISNQKKRRQNLKKTIELSKAKFALDLGMHGDSDDDPNRADR